MFLKFKIPMKETCYEDILGIEVAVIALQYWIRCQIIGAVKKIVWNVHFLF